jgi:hypothetical protein
MKPLFDRTHRDSYFGTSRMTNNLAGVILALVACVTLPACSREEALSREHTWTLRSGVEVLYDSGCQDATGRPAVVNVQKERQRYVISVESYQSCQSQPVPPWLTQTRNGKATLVIQSSDSGIPTSCECARNLKVAISDRLERGDMLFVVSDNEVLGYSEMQ